MYRNEKNLRFQADLYQLGMYQRDMLAMLRLKTISDDARKHTVEEMMRMHVELNISLARAFREWNAQ